MRRKLATLGIAIATFVACTGHGLVLRSLGDAGALDAGLEPDTNAEVDADDADGGFNPFDVTDVGAPFDGGFNPFDVTDVGAPFEGGVGFD